jgi:hypothetical protein
MNSMMVYGRRNNNNQQHSSRVDSLVFRTSLPKLNGNVRFWPSFLAINRRQTHECQFNQSENIQRLRDALEEPARRCY